MTIPVSTMGIGLDLVQDVAQQYVPPRVLTVPGPAGPPPTTVVYGAAQQIAVGAALPAGTWLVHAGAGTLDATTAALTVYPVTITNGPTPP